MTNEYILEHLQKWAELFYGKLNSKYCFARMKGEHYVFGFKKPNGIKKINWITKAVAIYLCIGVTPQSLEEMKKTETVKEKGKIHVPRIRKRT